LVIFIALGIRAGQAFTTFPWNAFLRFDPLAALLSLAATRRVLWPLFWGGWLLLLLTLFFGRAFCGWVCPLGTFLEWTAKPVPLPKARRFHWGFPLLIFTLTLAVLGQLWPAVLDPLTIAQRTVTTLIHPVLGEAAQALGDGLYRVKFLRGIVGFLDGLWRWVGILSEEELRSYRGATVFLILLLGLVALNRLSPRFWCRALCPLGSLLTLVGRFSPLYIRVDEAACTDCGLCAEICPILPADAERVDSRAECWRCADCVAFCPAEAVSFAWRKRPGSQPVTFEPSRRAFLGGVLAGLGALALFRADYLGRTRDPYAIRPPGARVVLSPEGLDESEFLARCIRCGLCWKVCPTNGLQPAFLETGIEGFWTPLLKPREGYCDYACTACGEICPTGAIERLSLEEKRRRVIGVAYIDEKRCIPYSRYTSCTVCEEMCPLPEKAIILEEREVITPSGERVRLRFPKVIHERCIGCGICENKCPLPDEAAIRVYAPFVL